jgi:hypothetical protein
MWKADIELGFPAKLNENNEFQRIFGYVNCFKYFQTFIYSSKSGTIRLKQHETKCEKVKNLKKVSYVSC